MRCRYCLAAVVLAALCRPAATQAQGLEVTPFGGYRFGGDLFEIVTRQPVDLDGAPAAGVVFDVPIGNGTQIEGLFTHQVGHFTLPARRMGVATRWAISVDQWQAGGLQEFMSGAVRPFATGTLGLTRYAAGHDSEIRFAMSAGGGVKLFPSRHVGLRLDGRLFATLVDADGQVLACVPGICLIGFDADVAWQAEFTAGVVVAFR